MPRPLLLAATALLLLSGCQHPPVSRVQAPTRTFSYTPPSEREVTRRAQVLERTGLSHDAATAQARIELAPQGWQPDPTAEAQAWAYEQARAARSRANEKMEKDLAKLDRP